MSEWDERRRKSWGYYLCLMLLLWPLLLIPIQFTFAPYTLTAESIAASLFLSVFVVVLAIGCGTRYRLRGINPGSRTVLSTIDDQYQQAKEFDESTNK